MSSKSSRCKILFLGAHTDDIELGAGGLLSYALETPDKFEVSYMSFSLCRDIERNKEIEKDQLAMQSFIKDRGGRIQMLDFPNMDLYSVASSIRQSMEAERDKFKPDLVLTHWSEDLHQDHKTVAEESLRVFKHTSLLSYEVTSSCPKFVPNFYFGIDTFILTLKVDLLSMYQTQANLYYTSGTAIGAQATYRGLACKKQYAEAYYINHLITSTSLWPLLQ